MIWVCRPGKLGKYYDLFLRTRRIYLAWDGYRLNLSGLKTRVAFREVVIAEKNPDAPTTISNWAGQLYSFCIEMQENDYVLIPSSGSKTYMLCRIISDYEYDELAKFPHSRQIEILSDAIPRTRLSQSTQYSLGAFRTVFKAKQEDEILRVMQSK